MNAFESHNTSRGTHTGDQVRRQVTFDDTDTSGISATSGISDHIANHDRSHNVPQGTPATGEFRQHDKIDHIGAPEHSNHFDPSENSVNTKLYNAARSTNAADDIHPHAKLHHVGTPEHSNHFDPSENSVNTKLYNAARSTNAADEFRQHDKIHHAGMSEHSGGAKQCIEFLSTITRVEVVDKVKDINGETSYVIYAHLANTNDMKSGATTRCIPLQRTFKEFKELQHAAEHWSKQHEHQGCAYCPFFASADLPNILSRIAASKDKMEREMQDFLYSYIVNARRPRPTEMACEGFDHIPMVVTRFITKDLPPADTAAMPAAMAATAKSDVTHGVTGKHAAAHGDVGLTNVRP